MATTGAEHKVIQCVKDCQTGSAKDIAARHADELNRMGRLKNGRPLLLVSTLLLCVLCSFPRRRLGGSCQPRAKY